MEQHEWNDGDWGDPSGARTYEANKQLSKELGLDSEHKPLILLKTLVLAKSRIDQLAARVKELEAAEKQRNDELMAVAVDSFLQYERNLGERSAPGFRPEIQPGERQRQIELLEELSTSGVDGCSNPEDFHKAASDALDSKLAELRKGATE